MHATTLAGAAPDDFRSMRKAGHSTTSAITPAEGIAGTECGSGDWIGPGRALRLAAPHDGELRVTEGRLWITFELRSVTQAPIDRLGDHVVSAGQSIALAAHECIVLESYDARRPARFEWRPAQTRTGAARQALRDLREAAVLAADALRRLLLPGSGLRSKRYRIAS